MGKKIGLYPGCSLETSAGNYLKSIEKVFSILDIDYTIMKNWNCCGATSVKTIDQRLNLMFNLRNLAEAEKQGYEELVVPCASCFQRLASTEFELMQDKQLRKDLSRESGYGYEGKVKVRNILDFLVNLVGLDKIASKVTEPLSGLVVASYYGCLNTRIPGMESFDIMEYPVSMDNIVKTLGAEVIDWSYKTECCGASLFLTMESVSGRLVGRILKDASLRAADCVTVSCPMCQTNLDTKQGKIRSEFSIDNSIPVPFITQLMGLAFGLQPEEVGLDKNFEKLEPLP
ncbi:MAG: CoB--CoM heterodisulfide reductase iron-sulfur subunit B family protein [Bacteroidales bacterium]|nr:CoB--CoM heterodisulfide reductase iron-sulfur subunit B family protein [Bacteroidales bacterium]